MKNKFNYRVCTNLEQSKQLINLGLTLETADMHLEYISDGIFLPGIGFNIHYCSFEYIPAWSLSRLIEICNEMSDKEISIKQNPFEHIISILVEKQKTDIFKKYFVLKK